MQVFVDTTGWAFTYPLARLAGCRVVAYTHYPMVSANMLQRVMLRTSTYNNQLAVAKSGIKSLIKMAYYYCVAAVYGAAGGFASVSYCGPAVRAPRCFLLALVYVCMRVQTVCKPAFGSTMCRDSWNCVPNHLCRKM